MPAANPTKKMAMEAMIRDGADLDKIAAELGYANGKSALVMANRWGLHVLRVESYSNPNRKALAVTADMLRESTKLLADK